MNDDELDRREETSRGDANADRPAVVAYDPYFPSRASAREDDALVPFDPYFSSDGASDFD